MSVRYLDGVFGVVVAFQVLLRNPRALEATRLDRRADMRTSNRDDVATPGIIASMRQRADRADVAGDGDFAQTKARDLKAETVGDAAADRGQYPIPGRV